MSKFMDEFKEFIARGNVMDMAVGVIVGTAFTGIVTSLVENIITPAIHIITGLFAGVGVDAESATAGLKWPVPGTEGEYLDLGAFIGAIVNFLIIAFVVFCMVKAVNKMRETMDAAAIAAGKKEAEPEPEPAPVCPHCLEEVKPGATRCPHCGGEI